MLLCTMWLTPERRVILVEWLLSQKVALLICQELDCQALNKNVESDIGGGVAIIEAGYDRVRNYDNMYFKRSINNCMLVQ